jgi:hypothetical protein
MISSSQPDRHILHVESLQEEKNDIDAPFDFFTPFFL